ncbi:hypothetical protein LOTGIDRAFT_129435, partial [Lottia gigantea]
CPPIFDNLLCWDEVPADTLVRQHCPGYYKGFVTTEYAYKRCTENGTWYSLPNKTRPWTNFTLCQPPRGTFTTGVKVEKNLRLLYTTGYGLSLFCLVIAVIIMFFCRQVLTFSLIPCASDSGVGFHAPFVFTRTIARLQRRRSSLLTAFHNSRPSCKWHWECRLIVSLFHFTICACHMWIFIEGLYLYMLIHKPFYTGRKGVSFYIILGWTLPVLNIIPWVIVKTTLENIYCWTVQENAYYFWILKGPGIIVIFVNIFFFVDIIRMLCMRMRSRDQHNGQSYRYVEKLTKFILVLIPLFGVTYIAFYAVQEKEGHTNIPYLYAEMTYNSFQGFILSFLFCFLNEDVHKELQRVWHRRKNRMGDHLMLTRSTLFSSWKKTSYPPHRAHSNFHSSQEHVHDHRTVERLIDRSDDLYKHALKRNAVELDKTDV